MPFYRALVRPGLLAEPDRELFADDVVDIHCGVTGAPPSFVHVLITEVDDDRLAAGLSGSVSGTIRSGRTTEQKVEMSTRIATALAERAGVDPDTVSATLRDIDASYTMEGGALLPEPGSPEEEAWKLAGSAGGTG